MNRADIRNLVSRQIFIAFALVFTTAMLLTACNSEASSRDAFNTGLKFWSDGHFQSAIDSFSQAISTSPTPDPSYYRWRACAYEALGNSDAAIKDYTKAIELNASNASTADYEGRGDIYLRGGKYQLAINDYDSAIAKNPTASYMCFANRGTAYFNLQLYGRALQDYTTAVLMKPDDGLAYVSRGRTYYFLGQYKESLADLTKALQLQVAFQQKFHAPANQVKPFFANAYGFRAQALRKLGKTDLAKKDEKTAQELGFVLNK
jgi:tetratricopeptide (TPR) repeat protein